MQYKYAEIADTVYFWFAANATTGAAGDGATPLYDVRLAGAAANAAPTASGTPTLLSHADYTDGLFEIAIDTTGYSAGEYAVFCTLTISTVNPAGFCGSFKLSAAGASLNSAMGLLTHADYGLAKLVRSTTPANTLAVGATGLVAVPDTQKVDIETIKTRAITCAAGVTVLANLGFAGAPGANNGAPTTNGTKINQTADLTAGQSIACSDKTGFSLSAAGVLAIWDSLTSALTAAGSIGKKLADWVVGTIDTYTGNTKQTGDTYARLGAPAGASVSADVAALKAETAAILVDTGTTLDDKLNTIDDFLDTEIAAILADTNELQTDWANGGRLDLILDAASAPSAADVADAVWNEVLHTAHEDAGSASVLLQAAGGAADPLLNAVPGAYGAGTAGKVLGDYLNSSISALRAIVDNIHDTDLPAVKTVADGIEVHVHTDIPALIPSAADIKTAVEAAGSHLTLIKAKTDKMTYTSGDDLDVNVQKINDVTLAGDGVGTPMGAV